MKKHAFILFALWAMTPALLCAQDDTKGVALHGSIQSDVLVPQKDSRIPTQYGYDVLTNAYVDVNMMSRYVDAGSRIEFLQYPLPGFEPAFKGWGIPHIYIKGKYRGLELTAGDFYEQFGSGLIFRTYEERSLGIDNALRGARLKMNEIKGLRLTALAGVQRAYWEWDTHAILYGADAEVNVEEYAPALQEKGITWTWGASYVNKHETYSQDILVPGTHYALNIPEQVQAMDVRTNFQKGDFGLLIEYARKGQDPSNDNGYIYRIGNATMLSASYSNRTLTALVQAKRSEDMAFRSQRNQQGNACFVNHMPAFTYQHTYSLAALYPYATQTAPGEWALQGEFGYQFKRKTALGGKYGTKIKLNVSHIRGLQKKAVTSALGTPQGGNGYETSFFKMGGLYYQDIHVQLDKKVSRSFKLNALYMNQRYNQAVIEGHGEMIRSHIAVLETKWGINDRLTLRNELQYLHTRQDEGDWAFALAELSVLPHFLFTLSDMWNCGQTDVHYYMASATYNVRSHRMMLSYGKTREGINCSGGVCRMVPATKGFSLAYNYTF